MTFLCVDILAVGKMVADKLSQNHFCGSWRHLSSWDQCYDFLNIFAEKFSEKISVFDSKQSQILKKLIITLVFEKNANFFAENWQKSQKIVIITLTPG
jgi:hypothetical protein